MQTQLADWIKDTPRGREADAVLRKCVHCGFCLATCPTYTLLGDELDSPRGRIYLMKQMLEGAPVTERTQLHLDRCLTCRACETTCPSGVEYGKLVDIGRAMVEERVPRPAGARFKRWFLSKTLPFPALFGAALAAPGSAAAAGLVPLLQGAVGQLLYRLDRYPEAIVSATAGLAQTAAGANHAARLQCFKVLGTCNFRLGRFADARRHYRQALAQAG